MSIKLQLPKAAELKPRIIVIGVGGAGGNAVNNMIASGLTGVEFVVANTDAQALAASSSEHRIQLGINLTEGLGAGSKPEIGQAAAEEAMDEVRLHVDGAHMVFIAAGMGGGTGTGAAAVIARIAKEAGCLVVAIVTKPFLFEGSRRQRIAEEGIAELRGHVDTMIVIPNQNLFRVANERTTFAEAFLLADQVLYSGIACIVDLIVKEGLINLDFADVRTVLSGMGSAMMGTGEATGERRAIIAAEEAIANPLLDDVSLRGARGLLLSIIGGRNLTLYEVDEAASRVRQEVDPDANIIVGATFDDSLDDRVRVSIVASGLASVASDRPMPPPIRPQVPPPSTRTPPPPAGRRPEAPVEQRSSRAGGSSRPAAEHVTTVPEAEELARALQATYGADRKLPPQRQVWQSADGVTIEEGLAPLATQGLPPPLPPGRGGASRSPEPPGQFLPQAPADVRRPPRRLPELEDFPVVGQRDYQSKANGPTATATRGEGRAGVGPKRRPGLFERITGWGPRGSEQPESSSPPSDARPGDAGGASRRNTSAANGGDERFPSDPDLPEFLERRRR